MTKCRPPRELKVSEWADAYRKLSPEASAEPGQFITARAEFQRGLMDVVNEIGIHTVVFMKSSQVGATEILNNIVGYFIHHKPGPILVMQPTLDMGHAWSKDRLAPMLRDTEVLHGLVKDPRTRDSGNTLEHKKFPGGHITITGANSAASLASRPIRNVLGDEVDRYPLSAGTEGDPVKLANKRTTTFWDALTYLSSTPTVKGVSRIEREFEESDKRYYFVPCPDCDEYQRLQWKNLNFDDGTGEAAYTCEHCGVLIPHSQKHWMIKNGRWEATATSKGVAGFHINQLYSPWVSWNETRDAFKVAKRGGPETLKVFVNTALGETWEEQGESLEYQKLFTHLEEYGSTVPASAVVLTCGIDVQIDRVELEVVAWGPAKESWSMDYRVIYGNPALPELWHTLDDYLKTSWQHESGNTLNIACACIDSGGTYTNEVYAFCKPKRLRRVFPIKGRSTTANPIITKPSKNNKGGVLLFPVGTDTAKELIYAHLQVEEPGPGYCHFRKGIHDESYFEGLTCEQIHTEYRHGHPVRVWKKPSGKANEPLDCRVYALAAHEILNPNFEKLIKRYLKQADPVITEEPHPLIPEKKAKPKKRRFPRKKGNFVSRWR